jgi:hypothetical protein
MCREIVLGWLVELRCCRCRSLARVVRRAAATATPLWAFFFLSAKAGATDFEPSRQQPGCLAPDDDDDDKPVVDLSETTSNDTLPVSFALTLDALYGRT